MPIGHVPFHKTRDLIGELYIIHQSHTLFHGKGCGLLTYRDGTAYKYHLLIYILKHRKPVLQYFICYLCFVYTENDLRSNSDLHTKMCFLLPTTLLTDWRLWPLPLFSCVKLVVQLAVLGWSTIVLWPVVGMGLYGKLGTPCTSSPRFKLPHFTWFHF